MMGSQKVTSDDIEAVLNNLKILSLNKLKSFSNVDHDLLEAFDRLNEIKYNLLSAELTEKAEIKPKTEYKLICVYNSQSSFVDEVNEHLKAGWELYGKTLLDLVDKNDEDDDEDDEYYEVDRYRQAMVKRGSI